MPSMMDVTSTSAGEMFLGAFVPGMFWFYYTWYSFLFSHCFSLDWRPLYPTTVKNGAFGLEWDLF